MPSLGPQEENEAEGAATAVIWVSSDGVSQHQWAVLYVIYPHDATFAHRKSLEVVSAPGVSAHMCGCCPVTVGLVWLPASPC